MSCPPMSAFAVMAAGLLLAAAAPSGAGEGAAGLAAKYPGDAGILGDPEVIFHDDFETWSGADFTEPPQKWHGRGTKRKFSITRTIPGKVTLGRQEGPGQRVLEIACWREGGGSQGGGVSAHLGDYERKGQGLGPGHEELYIRHYIRFDEKYKGVRNHGSNLGGRDVTRGGSRWVGMSNTRDVAAQGYFYSGLQPYGGMRKQTGIYMAFYSYHMDKPSQWGDDYKQKSKPIEVGRWYCLERRMKLNSTGPVKADGLEELWVDGVRVISKQGLRFRRVPELRINFYSLGNYYHGLPAEWTKENPIKVRFDNLVIAKKYIGPVVMKRAEPEAKSKSVEQPEVDGKAVAEKKAAKLFQMARRAELMGQRDVAKRLYEQIVEKHPDTQTAKRAKARLE